jgi:hypothetical protein
MRINQRQQASRHQLHTYNIVKCIPDDDMYMLFSNEGASNDRIYRYVKLLVLHVICSMLYYIGTHRSK